jgi:hypothetical protein
MYAIIPGMDLYHCKRLIIPNYAVPVFDVYFEVCRDHIINWTDHPSNLDQLASFRYSRLKNKHKGLPTWVVDRTSFVSQPCSSGIAQYATPGRSTDAEHVYCTSKRLTDVGPSSNGIVLVEVDSISSVISLENSATEVLSTLQAWMESRATQGLTTTAGNFYSRHHWRDFPWRTLCAEILCYGNVRYIEFSEIMLKAMAALNIEIELPEFVSKIVKEISVKISVITIGILCSLRNGVVLYRAI